MNQPRVFQTEALVLKGYDYGEADRVLTLYTPHLGKLRAIAKGVRRIKSRMGGHLDLFMRANLLVARGRQLDIVTQAETIENFRSMRNDLLRVSHCHYMAELVDTFTAEHLPNYQIYALALATLQRLTQVGNLDLAMRSFELQLLATSGYRPQLRRCVHCNREIAREINHFSSQLGGVLCPACSACDQAAPGISINALKVLRKLQGNETAVPKIEGIGDAVRQEVEDRLREYIVVRAESRPRSIAFLDHMRAGDTFPRCLP